MDRMKKRIAVLMASYNSEDTINRAVESVMDSNVPVDLYIIDDGSKVPVSDILLNTSDNIFIYRLNKNGGLPAALNFGIKILLEKNYEFIARFDADDFCYPERFEVQLDYFDNHSDIQAIGSWANAVDDNPDKPLFTIRHPEHHKDIIKAICYNSPFVHPTMIFRSESIRNMDKLYDVNYKIAQDYELMSRYTKKFKTANVPQVLIDYSYKSEISSTKKRRKQLYARLSVQLSNFTFFNIHSWLGIVKTLIFFITPMALITRMKKIIFIINK